MSMHLEIEPMARPQGGVFATPAPPAKLCATLLRAVSRILGCDSRAGLEKVVRFRVFPQDLGLLPQIETVCRLIEELNPLDADGEIYLVKWPRDQLFDLTLCLPEGVVGTVTLEGAMLANMERRAELRRRIQELFSQCLCKASAQ